ncbi:tRNA lysidine(34) synthetase TilS [Ovoidimarina sediminis]|uniref:tRNA lysidine(34) synthetase TilS n=1 Tax=Ovoidimarina sediminis TaxID=3079856 RepID=UPI00290AE6AA|nr:tRNA lysidine(34) synthetase TilS [Rhodophyticola sp. MJ-SS7]MDU8946519.1 tRNA lysidine(34) synthetase TilS [Rhodophyticola sp. MJ-SS7]
MAGLISPDTVVPRLGVAVSGGADSLALLHILQEAGGVDLFAVTVNHGLRPEAASEALHVARICEGLGIPHDVLEWSGWDGKGNLQDQARRTRYRLLADWGRKRGVDAIALGHTRDDVAETFLMRVARSSGVDGLAAMAPRFERDGMAFMRPLLDRGRAELREILVERGVRWVEDPSNEDTAFDRARIRAALPGLAPIGLTVDVLAETAAHLRDASDALNEIAVRWMAENLRLAAGDILFDRTALSRQPLEIKRRIVGRSLQWVASEEYPPRGAALGRVLAALSGESEGRNLTLHGCHVMVSDMTFRITREFAAVARLETVTDAPWDGRWHLDGPHLPGLVVRALGDDLTHCPDWRNTGVPRESLRASPAIYEGDTLIAAPVAGLTEGWTATCGEKEDVIAGLVPH